MCEQLFFFLPFQVADTERNAIHLPAGAFVPRKASLGITASGVMLPIITPPACWLLHPTAQIPAP